MAVNYGTSIVADALALALDPLNTRSYPGSGTTWSDLSPNKNNLTLQNSGSITYSNGAFTTGSNGNFNDTSSVNVVTPVGVMKVVAITTTGASSYVLPADFGAPWTVYCIGGGGGCGRTSGTTAPGTAGGGGAFSATRNTDGFFTLAANQTVYVSVGAGGTGTNALTSTGGAGGSTWFNPTVNTIPTSNATGILATGGGGGTSTTGTKASGGTATYGALLRNGGAGGTSTNLPGRGSPGGGAAGGEQGAGGAGGDANLNQTGGSGGGGSGGGGSGTGGTNGTTASGTTGAAGGNNSAGAGGATTAGTAGTLGGGGAGGNENLSSAGNGGAGADYALTAGGVAGPGGGGSGGGVNQNVASTAGAAGAGGVYGGGAGGPGCATGIGGVYGAIANGAQGIVIIAYSSTTSGATVEAWINVASIGTAKTIANASSTVSANNGWKFGISTAGYLTFTLNAVATYTSSTALITAGQWCQVAVTVSNTSGTFYLNGVACDTFVPVTVNGTPASYVIANDAGNNYFNSTIGPVKMYSKALSAAEIAQNFGAYRGRYGI